MEVCKQCGIIAGTHACNQSDININNMKKAIEAQQKVITTLRAELEKAKKDAEKWRYLVDNKANIITVENEKRGYRSTMPNAVWERWSEFEGYMISTSTTNETFKTYDEAIDNAMKGNS